MGIVRVIVIVLRALPLPRAALAAENLALPLYRKRLGDGYVATQYSRIGLARTLTQLGGFAEAEALLLDTAEQWERSEANRRVHWPAVIKWLVKLCDAWHAAGPDQGHDAKAAEWPAKLEEWQATTQPATSEEAASPAPELSAIT